MSVVSSCEWVFVHACPTKWHRGGEEVVDVLIFDRLVKAVKGLHETSGVVVNFFDYAAIFVGEANNGATIIGENGCQGIELAIAIRIFLHSNRAVGHSGVIVEDSESFASLEDLLFNDVHTVIDEANIWPVMWIGVTFIDVGDAASSAVVNVGDRSWRWVVARLFIIIFVGDFGDAVKVIPLVPEEGIFDNASEFVVLNSKIFTFKRVWNE